MKRVTLMAMIISLVGIQTVLAKEFVVKRTVGEYGFELRIDKTPPVVGVNNVSVEIKDTALKPVTDAKVVIEYSMPPMPGMAPMNYKAEAQLKGSVYHAKMNLSMSGSWNLAVRATRDGKTATMRTTIDVR